jgi:hypothetical protein
MTSTTVITSSNLQPMGLILTVQNVNIPQFITNREEQHRTTP